MPPSMTGRSKSGKPRSSCQDPSIHVTALASESQMPGGRITCGEQFRRRQNRTALANLQSIARPMTPVKIRLAVIRSRPARTRCRDAPIRLIGAHDRLSVSGQHTMIRSVSEVQAAASRIAAAFRNHAVNCFSAC